MVMTPSKLVANQMQNQKSFRCSLFGNQNKGCFPTEPKHFQKIKSVVTIKGDGCPLSKNVGTTKNGQLFLRDVDVYNWKLYMDAKLKKDTQWKKPVELMPQNKSCKVEEFYWW